MDRLTRRKKDGAAYVQLYSDPDRIADVIAERARKEVEVIERLAHYEDLAEQGRLVEMPCRLGEKAYRIIDGKVEEWTMTEGIALLVARDVKNGNVFLSKEEAEAKLAEKGGTNDE